MQFRLTGTVFQQFNQLLIVAAFRQGDGGILGFIFYRDIGAGCQKQFHHLNIFIDHCDHQSRTTLCIDTINIGAFNQQLFNDTAITKKTALISADQPVAFTAFTSLPSAMSERTA